MTQPQALTAIKSFNYETHSTHQTTNKQEAAEASGATLGRRVGHTGVNEVGQGVDEKGAGTKSYPFP